ncbi:tetratricopeptide repeat protein [Fodinibius sp.]|uniref:tetratricopeptide repeat protein n=1 Tax=Fodinibius sp. TaxID=1872440 RepID=UPI002ACD53C7|nr:tetratricopeptide repeat protein [Fodinibius sp.]MDZ7659771.1 tetratricopeptide repeat protein [Fodinibius sp.]
MTLKSSSNSILFLIFLSAGILCHQPVHAQQNKSYFEADQLLKEQKYEQAAKQFEQLYNQHPNRYLFLNKLTESLINLKEYEKAIAITKQAVQKGRHRPQAKIRLGELYHISGDIDRAKQIWNNVLKEYPDNQQVYLRVARTASDRKEFEKAIDIYEDLKSLSEQSNLISSELGETYMQAGNYERAMREFLELVEQNPDRLTYVQHRLMRFRDNYIYDVAILEISDFLDKLSPSHPSYNNLQQLEIWLLMERKLFERAVATAKNMEQESSTLTYSLYNIGSKLLAEQKFELAEESYSYYIDNNVASLANRCREELANVYIEWAKYLENNNLDLTSKPSSLYQKAFSTLNTLRTNGRNYHRMDQVLTTLSELSLDVLHAPDKAEKYLAALQNLSNGDRTKAKQAYIRGRLHLYDKEYNRARLSFSKSNNQERIGDLAEKNRYYLALTDFFAGDYEFAKIQLNALERQNTSYYANDAVQLRLWIQKGLQADSTGAKIEPIAQLIEHLSRGEEQQSITILEQLFQKDRYNPLLGYGLLELTTEKKKKNAAFIYRALATYLETQGKYSALREQLMWAKIRLADQLITNSDINLGPLQATAKQSQLFENNDIKIPQTVDQLLPLYEELLLQFPNGFYATFARDRIQELEETQV